MTIRQKGEFMKKGTKAICIVFFAGILFLACDGLVFVKNTTMGMIGLGSQENTTWVSEDGAITVHIHERGKIHTGTMSVAGKQIDFKLLLNTNGVYIYPQEEGTNFVDDSFEVWTMTKRNDDAFVVKVAETTYFESGQRITFRRTAPAR